jgi:hypothetical protein
MSGYVPRAQPMQLDLLVSEIGLRLPERDAFPNHILDSFALLARVGMAVEFLFD